MERTKSLHRRTRDWIVFLMLLASAIAALVSLAIEHLDKAELLYYGGGFGFVGIALYVALPFATGSEPTGPFHEALSLLFTAAVAVFLLTFFVGSFPLGQFFGVSENVEWSLLGVIVLSGGFNLFIAAPLSLLNYWLWRRDNQRG
jgi:hypothetical protein